MHHGIQDRPDLPVSLSHTYLYALSTRLLSSLHRLSLYRVVADDTYCRFRFPLFFSEHHVCGVTHQRFVLVSFGFLLLWQRRLLYRRLHSLVAQLVRQRLVLRHRLPSQLRLPMHLPLDRLNRAALLLQRPGLYQRIDLSA